MITTAYITKAVGLHLDKIGQTLLVDLYQNLQVFLPKQHDILVAFRHFPEMCLVPAKEVFDAERLMNQLFLFLEQSLGDPAS